MGLAGIEPATSALSVLRSNRLSYSPLQENNLFKILSSRGTLWAGKIRALHLRRRMTHASQPCPPPNDPLRDRPWQRPRGQVCRLVTQSVPQGLQIYSAGCGLLHAKFPEVMGSRKRLDPVKTMAEDLVGHVGVAAGDVPCLGSSMAGRQSAAPGPGLSPPRPSSCCRTRVPRPGWCSPPSSLLTRCSGWR